MGLASIPESCGRFGQRIQPLRNHLIVDVGQQPHVVGLGDAPQEDRIEGRLQPIEFLRKLRIRPPAAADSAGGQTP